MKKIDRLLIEAKSAAGLIPGRLYLAMVECCGPVWVSTASIWDGVQGYAPTAKRSAHETQEEAVEYLHQLSKLYPNPEPLAIIIDDVGG